MRSIAARIARDEAQANDPFYWIDRTGEDPELLEEHIEDHPWIMVPVFDGHREPWAYETDSPDCAETPCRFRTEAEALDEARRFCIDLGDGYGPSVTVEVYHADDGDPDPHEHPLYRLSVEAFRAAVEAVEPHLAAVTR